MKVFACHVGGDRCDLAAYDPLDEEVGTKIYSPYFLYVVEHRDGRVLFDSRLHPEVLTDPAKRVGAASGAFPVEMKEDGDLVSQLGELDLKPGDVEAVIQSHLHFDHAGVWSSSRTQIYIYVQSAQLEAARNPPVYQRDLHNPADFEHDLKWKTLDGDLDVFGDGKLRIISTPRPFSRTPVDLHRVRESPAAGTDGRRDVQPGEDAPAQASGCGVERR